jgi:hypothetical protein
MLNSFWQSKDELKAEWQNSDEIRTGGCGSASVSLD